MLKNKLVWALLPLVCLAIQSSNAADDTTLKPEEPSGPGYKNETGEGHHYGNYENKNNNGYERRREGYGKPSKPHYPKKSYGYEPRLVDDYICDLDASILVVTNSKSYGKKDGKKDNGYGKSDGGYGKTDGGYGKTDGGYGKTDVGYGKSDNGYGKPSGGYGNNDNGYGKPKSGYGYDANSYENGYGNGYDNNKYDSYGNGGYDQKKDYGKDDYESHAVAHRLRCSVIATRNDSDCTTCCQLAARVDRSISKHSIIGFIVDDDQIRQQDEYKRKKREAEIHPPASHPPIESSKNSYDKSSYGKSASYGNDYRPHVPYYPPINPKCVCCAPKQHNNYGHHDGGYGRKSYGSYDSPEEYGPKKGYGREQPYGPPPRNTGYGRPPKSYGGYGRDSYEKEYSNGGNSYNYGGK